MDEYDLEKEDILAAIGYAAKIVVKEKITVWYVYNNISSHADMSHSPSEAERPCLIKFL